jgi:hypothetical protein
MAMRARPALQRLPGLDRGNGRRRAVLALSALEGAADEGIADEGGEGWMLYPAR